MKKLIPLFAFLLLGIIAIAQPPQRINYQAVVRDGSGNLVTSQPVGLRFSIHDATSTGTVVYQETQNVTTNTYGSLSTTIGSGTVVSGTMAGIDWANNQKWLEIEMDVTGGTSYTSMGASELVSVPYAFYAGNSGGTLNSLTGSLGYTIYHNGTDWTTDAFLYNNGTRIGIGTNAPSARLHVADSSVVFTGTAFSGTSVLSYRNPPISGAGSRLMWYADKSAFRAGYVSGTQWDNASTGLASTATGFDVTASGDFSTALGQGVVANTVDMVAVGSYNNAPAGSGNTWIATDQLFAIGNGTSIGSPSNAITVLKNGKTGIGTISPTALLDVSGSFKLGITGSILTDVIKVTAVSGLPSIGPDSAYVQTFTVANATTGSSVVVSPALALADGLIISYARVSAANTVEVKFYNAATTTTVGFNTMNWYITVIR